MLGSEGIDYVKMAWEKIKTARDEINRIKVDPATAPLINAQLWEIDDATNMLESYLADREGETKGWND